VAGISESDLWPSLFDGKKGGFEQLTGALQRTVSETSARNARIATEEVSQV